MDRMFMIGDDCIVIHKSGQTRGKVVHAFVHWGMTQYVVESADNYIPTLYVKHSLELIHCDDQDRQVEARHPSSPEESRPGSVV
jgi:hypothetical protein